MSPFTPPTSPSGRAHFFSTTPLSQHEPSPGWDQQSGVPFIPFPDRNPYPKGDFYPVFHALLQHKCLLLVAFQITYRDERGLLRAPLCCALG